MTAAKIFDAKMVLPDATLTAREKSLLGFEERYKKSSTSFACSQTATA